MLSLVTARGVSRIELMVFFPGEVNGFEAPLVVVILDMAVLAQRATAASPADWPSMRASFQTSTVWVPRATRFRAAASPSCPETGTVPARPCDFRAAMTPPA